MTSIVSGRIRSFDETKRIISLYWKRKVQYFYIQRSLMNQIQKYIAINRFIQFTVTNEERLYKKHKVYTMDFVLKIMEIQYRRNIVYYDVKRIQSGTQKLINNLGTKMFLDLEMSMHPYKVDKSFKQEIIQVGYLLMDENDCVLERYNQVIQPTIHKKLSKRTLRFLEITQEDVDNGIPFKQFYTHFKSIIIKQDPAVIVWGRNDYLALRDGYKINRVRNINKFTRFINLLKLHKNYYHLKNDLGLFNALNLYYPHEDKQAHNAYEDAIATSKIFHGFREVVNHRRKVDSKQYK